MSRHDILVKVYGHVWPIAPQAQAALTPHFPLGGALELEEMLQYEGDMLRMSYEGVYIDVEELLAALQSFLHAESRGKVDFIDLEAWTLTRHSIEGTTVQTRTASLNTVLDYAGH